MYAHKFVVKAHAKLENAVQTNFILVYPFIPCLYTHFVELVMLGGP